MRLSILIVEDHDALREVTAHFLAELGHEVRGAPDAETMDEIMAQWTPDIVVLDVNLPGEDGHSACLRLRQARPALGIVMLTARTATGDRITGYDRGADVYLAKPTSNEELAAAIHSVARRVRPQEMRPQYQLREVSRSFTGPQGAVLLSEAELVMLRGLTTAPGRQLAHWQLMEALGLEPDADAKAALEVRVVRLRKKLSQAGAPDTLLQSVRGVGYRLQEVILIT